MDSITRKIRMYQERIAELVADRDKWRAEAERLDRRDCNATVELLYNDGDNPFASEKLKVVDVGVADNVYCVESELMKKLQAENAALRKRLRNAVEALDSAHLENLRARPIDQPKEEGKGGEQMSEGRKCYRWFDPETGTSGMSYIPCSHGEFPDAIEHECVAFDYPAELAAHDQRIRREVLEEAALEMHYEFGEKAADIIRALALANAEKG